ncbi:MAG: hypothetical protein ABIR80_07180, partial [Opitutaceae bacterium]
EVLRKRALAPLWRALFIGLALAAPSFAAPAPNAPPPLAQVGKPNAAQAKEILEQFRQSGIPGQFFATFELQVLPRRGETVVFRGRWWGSRNDKGAISRVELTDAAGQMRRLLLQNGDSPAVWRFADGKMAQLGIGAMFEPVIPGVEITAFDLEMPFLYWPDATVESVARIRGRPANAFLFMAPAAFTAQKPDLVAVRAYLDQQFNALTQFELLGAKRNVVKTFSLIDLKRVTKPGGGEQMIPKSFDLRNELTRDKTRLQITGVALDLDLSPTVFEPATLAEDVRAPAMERIVRIDP